MWQGEYFRSPPEIIGVAFAYTFFYAIEKVVLYCQLTKPKVVSLTRRPALLKHFKGTANHAGLIWSQQALVPSISVPSLQDWGWISLRGEWRLSCTPLSVITKLRVELIKYARVRRAMPRRVTIVKDKSQTLFFDYKHSSAWSIKSLGHRDIICSSPIFCIIAKVGSSLVRNGLYMMKTLNWVYTLDLKKILK